jgi:Family of unknown function (DUF6232)
MSVSEITFYQDPNVLITNTRAVIGGKTYAMANITSVTAGQIPPNRLPGILVAIVSPVVCICGAFPAAVVGGGSDRFAAFQWIYLVVVQLVALLILVGGVILAVTAKPTYSVKFASSAGETNALLSKDQEYIAKIVNAVNEAIVKRG